MAHIGRRGLLAGAAGVLAAVSAAAPARAFHGQGARGSAPVPAFRGMWVASVENVDWPSAAGLSAGDQEAELVELLDTAVRRRLNAVVLQVRPTADAMWPSALEPWSQWLTGRQGVDPGWDPLGTAVARAHERGLELHAWFNPYRVANHANPSLLVPEHPARLHPEWVVPYGGKLYYNPGLPEVRDFVQRAMLDAVRRYPLDAVHWDDYFYPYPVDGQYFDDDRAFEEHGSGFGSRADWRRYNIDTLVREMAAGIEAARPGSGSGSAPSRSGATRRRTRSARRRRRAWRRTTTCTPTPAAGSGRAGSTTSHRSSTGRSATRSATTRPSWTGGRGPSGAPESTS